MSMSNAGQDQSSPSAHRALIQSSGCRDGTSAIVCQDCNLSVARRYRQHRDQIVPAVGADGHVVSGAACARRAPC
eukprot:6201885-Pleurochrysis_carterae.AAC.1